MQDSPDAQFIIIANALPEVNGQTTEKKRAQEKKTGNFSSHRRGGSTDGTVYPNATRMFNWDAIFNLQTGHNKMFHIYCIISLYMI